LSFVKLYGTSIAKESVEAFKTTTQVSVDFRRGAFLGVQGNDVGDTCPIHIVHPGSPAEKAGLMHNDVIVRFGQDKVTSFSSLTDLISRRNAGDEVEIEVSRGSFDQEWRKTTVKVKLAPWELDPAVRNGRR
jgi:S1-C subfamily serine protease